MTSIYLSAVAICLTVVGLLFQHFAVIAKLRERLAALETKMDIFWRTIEMNVSKLLKDYPTNVRKDVLLDKLINYELEMEEAQELRTILNGEMDRKEEKHLMLAYILVIARLNERIEGLK